MREILKDILVKRHLPIENGSGDEGGDDGTVDLGSEAVSLVDLHVMSELQEESEAKSAKKHLVQNTKGGKTSLKILGEEESVRAGHDSVRLEVVHGEGVSGVDETTNELGKDVEGDLGVGDRVDDSDGDDEDDAESDSEEDGRDRGVGGVDWERKRNAVSLSRVVVRNDERVRSAPVRPMHPRMIAKSVRMRYIHSGTSLY